MPAAGRGWFPEGPGHGCLRRLALRLYISGGAAAGAGGYRGAGVASLEQITPSGARGQQPVVKAGMEPVYSRQRQVQLRQQVRPLFSPAR